MVSCAVVGFSRGLTVNQGNTRPIRPPFTNTLEIALEKIGAANLETLLDDLGGELVHAVLGCVTENMVDGSAAISWQAVLTDMLDAPIPELAMCYDVDAAQDLIDARTLFGYTLISS